MTRARCTKGGSNRGLVDYEFSSDPLDDDFSLIEAFSSVKCFLGHMLSIRERTGELTHWHEELLTAYSSIQAIVPELCRKTFDGVVRKKGVVGSTIVNAGSTFSWNPGVSQAFPIPDDYNIDKRTPLTVAQVDKEDVRTCSYHWFGLPTMVQCVFGTISVVVLERGMVKDMSDGLQAFVQSMPMKGAEPPTFLLGPGQAVWTPSGSAVVVIGLLGGNEAEPELFIDKRLGTRKGQPAAKAPGIVGWMTHLCLDQSAMDVAEASAIGGRLVQCWGTSHRSCG